jgi:hypothetical protein
MTEVHCRDCGIDLGGVGLYDACPNCGSLLRAGSTAVPAATCRVEAAPIGITSRRLAAKALQKHPAFFPALLALTFGVPWLSLVLSPWQGVVAGLLAGAAGLLLGFRAAMEIREYEIRREA